MSDILREPTEADVEAVTRLVHAAYAEHSDVGLNFTATDQSEAVTRYRLFAGQSWVIDRGGEVVATATVSLPPGEHIQRLSAVARTPKTAWLNQLAVHPTHRGAGLARRLLETAIGFAHDRDARALGLDTAAPALGIRALYAHWGFVERETVHWQGKTYDSVVMSRTVVDDR